MFHSTILAKIKVTRGTNNEHSDNSENTTHYSK